jgi:hypothetical protein
MITADLTRELARVHRRYELIPHRRTEHVGEEPVVLGIPLDEVAKTRS